MERLRAINISNSFKQTTKKEEGVQLRLFTVEFYSVLTNPCPKHLSRCFPGFCEGKRAKETVIDPLRRTAAPVLPRMWDGMSKS